MHLEIVSHCWKYSRLLTYQLSSLLLYPPTRTKVTMTVCVATQEHDPETATVRSFFGRQAMSANVCIRWITLEKPMLFRRAIGRDLAALETGADWVWFADCDMVFGARSLDSLNESLAPVNVDLVHPRHVHVSRTYEHGDAAIASIQQPQLAALTADDFVRRRYMRAIGGVQIVRGHAARRLGYCNETKYQIPTTSERWLNPTDDVKFRRILGLRGEPIEVPNLFRLRHSKRGQDCAEISL